MTRSVLVAFTVGALALIACGEDPIAERTSGVNPPALWLWVAEREVTIAPGESRAVKVAVGRAGHFTGAITVSLVNPPTGVSVDPVVLGADVSSGEITIRATATVALVAFPLALRATGAGASAQTTSLTLTIVGYTLSILPTSIVVGKGTRGSAVVLVTHKGAFAGAVTLSAPSVPNGVAVAFETADGIERRVRIDVRADVVGGRYPITIVGTTINGSNRMVTLMLTVPDLAPDFTLSLSPSAISVGKGAQGAVYVRVDHQYGVLSDLTVRAIGAPPGVSVRFDSVTSLNSDVTGFAARFDAGALAATGVFPVEIRVASDNGLERSTTLDLTVTSVSASGNTTVRFCPEAIPLWFAFQDGVGAWATVTGSGDTYRFDVTSNRGAVAWVLMGAYGGFFATVVYGSQSELITAAASTICQGLPRIGTKTVHGSVAGVAPNELVEVTLGRQYGLTSWDGHKFTLRNVADGPADLIASRIMSDSGYRMNAGIIRRNLNPANYSTMPVVDFSSGEAFLAATQTLTIAKAPADALTLSVLYRTATGHVGYLSNEDPYWETGSTASLRRYGAFPSAAMGDLQMLYLATPGETRWLRVCFRDATDRSVAFPPAFGPVDVTSFSSGTTARVRVRYDVQPEYPRGLSLQMSQSQSGTTAALTLIATDAYLQGAARVDLTSPDFASLAGWNADWDFHRGRDISWGASPGRVPGRDIDCRDGSQTTGGHTAGTIRP